MRVAPILTAAVVGFGLTACGAGGGGGPGDLKLGPPTSPPVTTTTTTVPASTTSPPRANGGALVARARFAKLAVYESPDAPQPERVLDNPWTPEAAPRARIPQVFLVEARQGDGWVKVSLPDSPQPTSGWVRSFDVKLTTTPYRLRIAIGSHRVTVFQKGRRVFHGPIRVADAQKAGIGPGAFYLRRVEPARTMEMTASPYTYRFIASLATQVPLGSPVDLVR